MYKLHVKSSRFVRPASSVANSSSIYDHARPDYPSMAMTPLKKVLRIEPDPRKKPLYDVVDVGAGSGKLTKALKRLLPKHTAFAAVEPSLRMRAKFNTTFPDIPVIDGTYSGTYLPPESVGNITIGHAIQTHAERHTLEEFHRILVPNGVLGIVWNSVDLSETPFMHEVDKILKSYNILKPTKKSETHRLKDCFKESPHLFSPLEAVNVSIVHSTTVEAVVKYLLTLSVVESLPHRRQTDIRLSIARLIESSAEIYYDNDGRKLLDLPCKVEMFWCTKLPINHDATSIDPIATGRVMTQ
ncbi:hypothetical protein THRCLA_08249 [Thraustotheca clavata]|uniref:Methyltransferase domain-containing protein n=1 Tax=Thraustotheca clavata TaxID=74557 RepID=A0A1V9Z7X4_9STRA|nr:hypothetical protein THRCLA_08249 [Thraustotheca clavata]